MKYILQRKTRLSTNKGGCNPEICKLKPNYFVQTYYNRSIKTYVHKSLCSARIGPLTGFIVARHALGSVRFF